MIAGPDDADEVGLHLRQTARVYDELPYTSLPVCRSQPARIGAIASLFGLDPVPPARARVLELGCAAGGNLIPLAARYPQSRFVGIDLGHRMIEDGNARIAAMGLANIELRTESITDFGEDNGTFDYIVCHGVYSWVPPPVRAKILEICGRQLSPGVIAYISYNVLPGWRLLQPVRDAMRVLTDTAGSLDRARQGRAMLGFLAKNAPGGHWGTLLRRAQALIADDDTYLFHEFMEPINEPCLFADFVGAADSHGLAYLGEAELSIMLPDAHGEGLDAQIAAASEGTIQQQQMLDLLVGTAFRPALLVRRDQAGRIDRSGLAARLASLHFVASGNFRFERRAEDEVALTSNSETAVFSGDAETIALLERLFAPIPRTWTLDAWREGIAIERAALLNLAWKWIVMGVVAVTTEPLVSAGMGEHPRADPLARCDAALGHPETASPHHHPVALDANLRFLLPMLDGSSNRAGLSQRVLAAVHEGLLRQAGPAGDAQAIDAADAQRHADLFVSATYQIFTRLSGAR